MFVLANPNPPRERGAESTRVSTVAVIGWDTDEGLEWAIRQDEGVELVTLDYWSQPVPTGEMIAPPTVVTPGPRACGAEE